MFRSPRCLSHTLLALAFAIMLPTPGISQQVKQRAVQLEMSRDQPVEIVDVKVKGVSVKPKQKFDGDTNWLDGMTIKLKNVSDRPVSYASVLVTTYYEKDGRRSKQRDGEDVQAAIELMYGAWPPDPDDPAPPYSPPLLPGETLDLTLTERSRDELYSLLRQDDASTDIAELTVRVYRVFFAGDNDTMWKMGRMLRRDPNDFRRWHPIPPDTPSSRTTRNRIS